MEEREGNGVPDADPVPRVPNPVSQTPCPKPRVPNPASQTPRPKPRVPKQIKATGKRRLLVIVAEGAVTNRGEPIVADAVRAAIEANVHIEARTTVLGHTQRGGTASYYDRCMVRACERPCERRRCMGPDPARATALTRHPSPHPILSLHTGDAARRGRDRGGAGHEAGLAVSDDRRQWQRDRASAPRRLRRAGQRATPPSSCPVASADQAWCVVKRCTDAVRRQCPAREELSSRPGAARARVCRGEPDILGAVERVGAPPLGAQPRRRKGPARRGEEGLEGVFSPRLRPRSTLLPKKTDLPLGHHPRRCTGRWHELGDPRRCPPRAWAWPHRSWVRGPWATPDPCPWAGPPPDPVCLPNHSIENGFKGLMNGEVKELSWMDVDDWAAKGGSKLGACVNGHGHGKRDRRSTRWGPESPFPTLLPFPNPAAIP